MGKKPKKPRKEKPAGQLDTCEEDLVAHLRSLGCRITTSKKLDGDFKIDALIETLPDRPEDGAPIGLQISHQRRDLAKTRTFFEKAARWPGVGALLYAKVDLSWGQPASLDMARAALEILTMLWDLTPLQDRVRRKAFIRKDGTWRWMDSDA